MNDYETLVYTGRFTPLEEVSAIRSRTISRADFSIANSRSFHPTTVHLRKLRRENFTQRLSEANRRDSQGRVMHGQIDNMTRECIEGWAWNPEKPDQRVRLAIYDNGVKVATTQANVIREDLRQSGIGDGAHAFVWNFSQALSPAISHSITVKSESGDWTLPGFEAALPAETATPLPLEGSLDDCDRHVISGWAQDRTAPDEAVPLQILDGDTVIATVLANRYRDDLKKAGLGDGHHAFQVSLAKASFNSATALSPP